MVDEQTTQPGIQTLGNSEAARTSTGEIKDNQATQPKAADTTATSTTSTTDGSTKAEDKGTSLLNQDGKTEPKAEDKKDDKAKPPAKGEVPEKYEFKAPEGHEIDTKFVEEATPVLKELGLSNEQAQKLVDLYSKKALEQAEAPYKAYEEMRDGWRKDIYKDPTLGDGSGLKPAIKASISQAIDSLGPELGANFRKAMDLTGAGDNPAFVKAMAAWAERLGEGKSVQGKGPSALGQQSPDAKPKSAANALYPNLPSSANG